MSTWHRRCLAALIQASGLMVACTGSASEALREKQLRPDRYGDPLPADALYRLGSTRFRIGRPVEFLTFSKDGKTLLSISRESWLDVVRCWDTDSGKQLREFPLSGGSYGSAALSPDGKILAALRLVKGGVIIQLVDTTTGKEVRSFAGQEDEYGGVGIAFAPDGRMLAVVGKQGTILLWDPASGKSLGQWRGDQSSCCAIAFSPDGKRAASVDRKSIVHLWDRATGRELRRVQVTKDPCGVASLAFSPAGETLAACCGGPIVFWNTKTGQTLRNVGKWHPTLAVSPDGKLVAAEQDGAVYLLDVSTGKEVRKLGRRISIDPDYDTTCLAFSPDGKLLATGCRSIRLWRVTDGAEVRPRGDDALEIDSAVFTRDRRFLATGGPDEFIRLWDMACGAEARRFKARAPDEGSLAFSRDGKMVFLRQGKRFFLWDWATGKEIRSIDTPPEALWHGVLSPSSRMLAWVGKDRVIHLRDVTTGKDLHSWKSKVKGISSLRFSPQGNLLITTYPWAAPPQSEIRDVTTGEEHSLGGREDVLVAVSEDERIAARLDNHGSPITRIHFQEMASGRDLACTGLVVALVFNGSGGARSVDAAVFSPDGRTLAMAIEYGSILLWETATGKERYRLPKQKGRIEQLAFAPDGNKLVSVSTEKNAIVWRVFGPPPGQQPAELSTDQLRGLWADLASDDGQVTFRASRALTAAAPGPVVDFLRRQGDAIPRLDIERVAHCIAELDSEEFAARENATAELARLGVLAEVSLRKALQDHPSLETRKRLEMLLDRLKDKPITPTIVRGWRAVEALEHLPTPEARKLLEEWAKDVPQAKASLERLAKSGRNK